MRLGSAAALFFIVTALAQQAQAQSLAEIAKREKERRAHKRLQEAQQELEQAREALAELREEARRAGALPGWLR